MIIEILDGRMRRAPPLIHKNNNSNNNSELSSSLAKKISSTALTSRARLTEFRLIKASEAKNLEKKSKKTNEIDKLDKTRTTNSTNLKQSQSMHAISNTNNNNNKKLFNSHLIATNQNDPSPNSNLTKFSSVRVRKSQSNLSIYNNDIKKFTKSHGKFNLC